MDQSELAERIGATRLWVSQIERGKPGANLGMVLRALSAVGIALEGFDRNAKASACASFPEALPQPNIDDIIARARRLDES